MWHPETQENIYLVSEFHCLYTQVISGQEIFWAWFLICKKKIVIEYAYIYTVIMIHTKRSNNLFSVEENQMDLNFQA